MWNVQKIVSKGDYNYAVVPEHPKRTKNNYVLEHRVVMENYLGRLLDDDEVVHHINGNKKDNRIENLEVLSNEEHAKLHGSKVGHKMVMLKCPWCKKVFSIEKRQSFLDKHGKYPCTCCSNECRGKLYSRIQHHGLTIDLQEAISGNLLAEYIEYIDEDNSEETLSQWGSVETIRFPSETMMI